MPVEGSSPLTRGKPSPQTTRRSRTRIIPAHAGKTPTQALRPRSARDHPRSRGENTLDEAETVEVLGSSPLTRGKPPCVWSHRRSARIIPAHAGKTARRAVSARLHRDHPRSRGENLIGYLVTQRHLGSSPLTRGKHFLTCAFIAQIGQILESLELCASSESYSSPEAYATDALQGRVRSIDLGLRSSRGAS